MFFEKIGLSVPKILLPKKGADMEKWAVIACDQYLTDRGYWKKVESFVGNEPSTLNMIFAEAFLGSKDIGAESEKINSTMREYADSGIFAEFEGFVLVDRTTSAGKSRKGLVVALDLEQYDYNEGSQKLIRTTEGTFLDKVEPRVKIRENALLEVPHILVLIDDPGRTVIEPLFEKGFEKIYDFGLMLGGGHVKGYKVSDKKTIEETAASLARLADTIEFNKKYGLQNQKPFLYAMGDGNHSFATAKQVWENLKKNAEDKEAIMRHPARFGLVELVNIHDEGLEVEPIHRSISDADMGDFFKSMAEFFSADGSTVSLGDYSGVGEVFEELKKPRQAGVHAIPFVKEGKFGLLEIQRPKRGIEMESMDAFLDDYIEKNPRAKLSFLHGEKVVTELGSKPGTTGFYLRGWRKSEIFKKVLSSGIFPRKTFSLGHADDKRFYIESRKIVWP